MRIIDILCETHLVGRSDVPDDGYKSTEEWSGDKEERDSTPLDPLKTPQEDRQSKSQSENGNNTSQREEMNLRKSIELKVDNPNNIDLVDATTVNDSQNHDIRAEGNKQRTSSLVKVKSVGNSHQNEEGAGPLVEHGVPIVLTRTDDESSTLEKKLLRANILDSNGGEISPGAGQEGHTIFNVEQPKQGQHHSQNIHQNQVSQFSPTHRYDQIANQISGDQSNNIQP